MQKKDWNWLNENSLPNDKVSLSIPKGLHLIWLMREDLQNRFDLNTKSGRVGMITWWLRLQGNRDKVITRNPELFIPTG